MKVAMRTGALVVAITSAGAAPRAEAQETNSPVAFVNVNVIPMDHERVLPAQTVVVEGGRISRIGPAARVSVPAGATVVDGRGKYLLPGLADLHVHLVGTREEQSAILKMFAVNGVTTILNLRGALEHLTLRADIAAGRVLGPMLYTAGPYVNQPYVNTPDEVERAVVEQKRTGYDFVKMHGDLSREAYARLNTVGRREGIRIVGHAPRTLGLDAMFEEKQYAVVHAEEFIYDRTHSSRDFEKIEPMIPGLAHKMRAAGIWLMPNFTAFKNIGGQVSNLDSMLARPEMRFMPRAHREGWGPSTNPYTRRFGKEVAPGIFARYGLLEKIARGFHGAGVRLLIGTDAMNTGTVPGVSAHDEMQDFVRAGLTPHDALRAATANAAEFLGKRDGGTLAVGKTADLLLLDGNPLDDIANTRRIAGVMLRGSWLPPSQLQTMLEAMAS